MIIYVQEYSAGMSRAVQNVVEGFVDEKTFVQLYDKCYIEDMKNRGSCGDAIGQNRAMWAKILEEGGASMPSECYSISYYRTQGKFYLELVEPNGKVWTDICSSEEQLIKKINEAWHEKAKVPYISPLLASQ